MNDESLWKAYKALRGETDINRGVRVLEQCIREATDSSLVYCANRDLGMLYAGDDSVIRDPEKAKKYLSDAAFETILHGYEQPDVYDEVPCQTMGQLLFGEGDMKAFYYLKEGLKLGSVWSAWLFYRELYERDNDDSFSKYVQKTIRNEISDLVRECREAIENSDLPATRMGVPQFTLGMVGIYRLGDEVGIDVKRGMEYLRQSKALGNGHAEDVLQYRELQNPEDFPAAVEKMKNGTLTSEEDSSDTLKAPRKKKSKVPLAIAGICVLAVVLFLARKIIFAAVIGIAEVVAIVVAAVVLVYCLYVYREDGGSGNSGIDWAKPEEKGFVFPKYLVDDNGHVWEQQSGVGNVGIYFWTNQTKYFYPSDFDPVPTGFHIR